jgi:hypothetical protein
MQNALDCAFVMGDVARRFHMREEREEGYTIKYAPQPRCSACCSKTVSLFLRRHDKEDGHSYVEGAIKLSRGDRDEVM